MEILYLYLILINAAAFLLMLIDKHRAVKNKWRIPEKVLLLSGLFGGSLGAIWGMKLFRHKTQKIHFSIGLPLIFALQIIFAIFLLIYARIV